ncbi:MAG: stage II sporulation protein M [Methanosarcinales archaeon]|nr:stage II sporulation protein M [Methanosarcinales archaeon]
MINNRLTYLISIKYYFIFNTCLFALAIAAGYITAYSNPGMVEGLIAQFEESYGWLANESHIKIMLFIFFNNTMTSFLAMVMGIFFGIWPVLFILFNGVLIGAICFETIDQLGVIVVLFALIPHGIIEIPMILLSASIGLRLGILLAQKILVKDSTNLLIFGSFKASVKKIEINIKQEVISAIIFFVSIIVPLLFVAALIETYVTSFILYFMTST